MGYFGKILTGPSFMQGLLSAGFVGATPSYSSCFFFKKHCVGSEPILSQKMFKRQECSKDPTEKWYVEVGHKPQKDCTFQLKPSIMLLVF